MTITWYNIPVLKDALYELIPAFVLSILVTMIVSWSTKEPDNAKEMFESMEGATVKDISSE